MNTTKSVAEYLAELQKNIETVHEYADAQANKKQQEYVAQRLLRLSRCKLVRR